ncbi:hypothetical protein D3C86_1487440 [compost metagenome]
MHSTATPSITGRSKSRALGETDNGDGAISAVTPSTPRRLNRLLPITLPTAISRSPRNAAINEVASSGREVLTATMVKPMIRSDKPRSVATTTAAPSNKCPAYTSIPSPATISSRLVIHGASPAWSWLDTGRTECRDWRSNKARYRSNAANRITPSARVNSSFHASTNTSRLAPIISGMSRRTNCLETRSGIISAESPRVTRMLKMLLPITLPTAMSALWASVA